MSSCFSTESNKKIVIKWKQEHKEITASAGKIIKAYETSELNIKKE